MSDKWNTVIRPKRGWWDINIKDIFEYKFLMFLFVKRDFDVVFKQTILGPLWYIIQPLFTSGIFTMIFGAIAKLPTDNVPQPLFYFAGVSLWAYLSSVMTSTANTFQINAGMFGKVYFPRLTVPIAQAASKFITFGIQFIFLIVIYAIYLFAGTVVRPTIALTLLPLIIILGVMFSMGIGLWVAAWSVKYRDLTNLFSFGVGLMLYATPVIYPLSMVQGRLRGLMYLNPLAGIFETYRFALFGQGSLDMGMITITIIVTCVVFLVGVLLFSRAEQTAMDVV